MGMGHNHLCPQTSHLGTSEVWSILLLTSALFYGHCYTLQCGSPHPPHSQLHNLDDFNTFALIFSDTSPSSLTTKSLHRSARSTSVLPADLHKGIWTSPSRCGHAPLCHLQAAAAAAAKSLQSCPTLSDPMDRSLPGSSIHGIFQARVLEWGAIAFSNLQASANLFCSLISHSALE